MNILQNEVNNAPDNTVGILVEVEEREAGLSGVTEVTEFSPPTPENLTSACELSMLC